MFVKNVYTFRNLPVEEGERRWTDCLCTIISAIFALTLFILACCTFNRSHYLDVNYPMESAGKACARDLGDAMFIYFANPKDFSSQRYCVQSCPKSLQQIQCSSQDNCAGVISSYDTVPTEHRLGLICSPADQALQTDFWNNSAFTSKLTSVHGYEIMLIALAIGVGVGLLYLVLFILLPKIMSYLVFVLCALTLIVAAILLLVQPIKLMAFEGNTWNIIIAIALIILAIFIFAYIFCQRQELELASIFLTYANLFLKENAILFLYIPLFIVLSFGLVVLIIWQFIAFTSINAPTWDAANLFRSITPNLFLVVLNFIEFVWGIQFIRDCLNYIISGNAVEWYFNFNHSTPIHCSRSVNRLLCKNWGSVVAGSFLNAFFSLFGLVFDFFHCDPHGTCGRANTCCKEVFYCCFGLFDLIRPDAYAYIHLSGIPYCNAARQCQALCEQTHLFNSQHTCIRLYRLAAQIFVVTLSLLLTFIIFRARTDFISMLVLALVICNLYMMCTHFVDLHPNAAEGLITCYLAESNCEANNLEICPANLRSDVYNYEEKYGLVRH